MRGSSTEKKNYISCTSLAVLERPMKYVSRNTLTTKSFLYFIHLTTCITSLNDDTFKEFV